MSTIAETLEGKKASVADLVLRYPAALQVLKKHHIDFCCGGQHSLEDACAAAGINPDEIFEAIQTSKPEENEVFRVKDWSSSFLADFIVQNHHTYVRNTIPEIQELLDKVCSLHGGDAPELLMIREDFNTLAAELLSHMDKEENILFPAIKHLDTFHNGQALIGNIDAPIAVMEHEHESAGDLIKAIRKLSNNFTPPAYACPTFLLTYQRLEEFEADLMTHIHLENNVLFKRLK
ncbi:MAG: iron-sulfur cluster repair di-iron protein [Cyclobacteriaceae bacterium]|nr:iron-sulfur cluster repair di-iron protein [Cyclobacteriaceae bacterium]